MRGEERMTGTTPAERAEEKRGFGLLIVAVCSIVFCLIVTDTASSQTPRSILLEEARSDLRKRPPTPRVSPERAIERAAARGAARGAERGTEKALSKAPIVKERVIERTVEVSTRSGPPPQVQVEVLKTQKEALKINIRQLTKEAQELKRAIMADPAQRKKSQKAFQDLMAYIGQLSAVDIKKLSASIKNRSKRGQAPSAIALIKAKIDLARAKIGLLRTEIRTR